MSSGEESGMNENRKFTMASPGNEEEIQRICIALTQDREAYLYRYRRTAQEYGTYYWTLSNVLSLREYTTEELKGTRLTEKEIASLENYDKKVLQEAAWEVTEDLIIEMCDRDMLEMDEENHQAHATETAYEIGEMLIKKWNL